MERIENDRLSIIDKTLPYIVHDMNGLLNSVLGRIELLELSLKKKYQTASKLNNGTKKSIEFQHIDKAKKNSLKAAQLLTSFRNITRKEDQEIKYEKEIFVEKVVSSAVDVCRSHFKHGNLILKSPANFPEVKVVGKINVLGVQLVSVLLQNYDFLQKYRKEFYENDNESEIKILTSLEVDVIDNIVVVRVTSHVQQEKEEIKNKVLLKQDLSFDKA